MAKIPVPKTDFTVFVKTEKGVAPRRLPEFRLPLGDFGDCNGELEVSKGYPNLHLEHLEAEIPSKLK